MGGQTRLSPQTPLGNFSGLILRIALGATRGDAELETDRERSEYRWETHWVWMPQLYKLAIPMRV
jgi:hypothetical protein